jgi:hypothetical protein
MSVTHLRAWDVTAIEIALDLEMPHLSDPASFVFSGPSQPRICLVAGLALTSHLKRLIAAVDRAMPQRPPAGLRIAPPATRSSAVPGRTSIAVRPMSLLLRLQSKLLRAIEPGLAHYPASLPAAMGRETDETTLRFIRDFVAEKAAPVFEPPFAARDFDSTDVKAVGLTIYRLGRRGAPQSILAHWSYPQHTRSARAALATR